MVMTFIFIQIQILSLKVWPCTPYLPSIFHCNNTMWYITPWLEIFVEWVHPEHWNLSVFFTVFVYTFEVVYQSTFFVFHLEKKKAKTSQTFSLQYSFYLACASHLFWITPVLNHTCLNHTCFESHLFWITPVLNHTTLSNVTEYTYFFKNSKPCFLPRLQFR